LTDDQDRRDENLLYVNQRVEMYSSRARKIHIILPVDRTPFIIGNQTGLVTVERAGNSVESYIGSI